MGGEDGFGFGCPCEGLRVLIAMIDPFMDRGFEFRDIMEHASSDALARDLGEEPLDEIDPRAGCWGEVELETLLPGEPALHLLCLVRSAIVDDEMQIEADGSLAVDLPEELQVFVCPVARQADTPRLVTWMSQKGGCPVRAVKRGAEIAKYSSDWNDDVIPAFLW